MPDGYTSTVFCHCHTRLVGRGLGRTIDGFGSVPLRTGLLLGVVDAIDAAGALHGLVQVQAVFQVLLGNPSYRLLHHHQVGARHGSGVVIAATAYATVREGDGIA